MKRTLLSHIPEGFPSEVLALLRGGKIYDSSCSPEARVYFIDRDSGYYLKRSPKGSLLAEARMTEYFHSKGLAASVLHYESNEEDWLLTSKVTGEDLTYATYLDDPKRLCDTHATQLRKLHEISPAYCPVKDRLSSYISLVSNNYNTGNYDKSAFPDSFGYSSPKEAWDTFERGRDLLKSDTLIHGDYCLPNVIYDDWSFSGYIDLGNGGVGDRHIDIFWGIWTLWFNLKTDKYASRFIDAYGKELVDFDALRTIAAAEVFG